MLLRPQHLLFSHSSNLPTLINCAPFSSLHHPSFLFWSFQPNLHSFNLTSTCISPLSYLFSCSVSFYHFQAPYFFSYSEKQTNMLRFKKETKQPNISMEMHTIMNQASFTPAWHQATSTTAIMMKIIIIMVSAMEYYSQVCSGCLRIYQNESQGGEGPPSFCSFVVRY